MSTKTTFKRLALVTVAALGMGTLSAVVPTVANAAYYSTVETPFVVTVADTVVGAADYNATTGVWDSGTSAAAVAVTQVAGPGNYVELTANSNDTTTATYVTVTVVGTTIAVGTQPTTSGAVDTFTVNTAGTVATSNNYRISGAKLRVMVPAVGTYTATVAKTVVLAGQSTTTDQQVFTITGVAAATRGVVSVANSTSIFDSGTAAAAHSADETIIASGVATNAGKSAGRITLTLKDGQATPAAVASKVVSVSIAGPGLLVAEAGVASGYGKGTAVSGGARVATATTNSSGQISVGVIADGTPGVGTITIAVGTTVISTETVTFYGEATKLDATVVKSVVSTTNAATLKAIEVKATDSAGRLVTGLTTSAFTATSSNAAVIASAITVAEGTAAELAAATSKGPGYYYVTVSSAAAGTIASGSSADITVKYTYSATQIVTANAVKVSTGGAVIYGVTLTPSSTSTQPGALVTLTLKATDKAGNPVADGTYVVFDTTTAGTALVASAVLTTSPYTTGAVTFTNGAKTATFYAPSTGSVKLTGVLGGDVAAALVDTEVTTSIAITSDALEAANAATTAALAANDAVDALAATVAKLVANLKAQITALTKLIVKIQKKVGA